MAKIVPGWIGGLEGSGNGSKTSSRSNSEGVTGLAGFSCAHYVLRRATFRLFLRLDSIPFSADGGGGCLPAREWDQAELRRRNRNPGQHPEASAGSMIPVLERSRRERTRPPAPPSTSSTLGVFPTPTLVEIYNPVLERSRRQTPAGPFGAVCPNFCREDSHGPLAQLPSLRVVRTSSPF
jgi:hypothetical protein